MEFVCPDPKALVRAANVRATLDAFKLTPGFGQLIVKRHKLDLTELEPGNFVLVQRWLDVMKEIQAHVGTATVRQVGINIFHNAEFPPMYDSVEAILASLDRIYYLNHRGNVGHYHTSREGGNLIVIRCETPYPRHFEWGLIEGICRGKAAKGRLYEVTFIEGAPKSDVTCSITVRPK
jgi:hypothetical protein